MSADAAAAARRIGIVEDDAALRRYYAQLVQEAGDLELAFAAASLAEARAAITKSPPDLCLVDLALPDGSGIDIVRQLKRTGRSRILVSTVFGDRSTVIAALKAGADGYVLKSMGQDETLAHMRQTLDGLAPVSPQIAAYLIQLLRPPESDSNSASVLTPRETEVLSILARGLTYDETAKAMGVSTNTVRDFIKKTYAKLDVHTRSEALYEAGMLGLIEGNPKSAP